MWRTWTSRAAFEAWQTTADGALGYPKVGVNAATGLPDPNAQITVHYTAAVEVSATDVRAWVDDDVAAAVPTGLGSSSATPYPVPVDAGSLVVDRWTVPADGVQHAVATFGCGDDAQALFVVNGQVVAVPADRGNAVLEIAIDAPGAIDVRIRDKQITIIGVAP